MFIRNNDDFYVYVQLSSGGHAYDRTSDVPVLLGAKTRTVVQSSANPGESYYLNGTTWDDLTDYDNTANFCLKALVGLPLTMQFPDGLPRYLNPGAPTNITVKILETASTINPGTETLNYRYSPGNFSSVPMLSIGNNLYIATLPPATCGQTPEFYFSAEASVGGIINSPTDAPNSVYTAQIGELIHSYNDDFEANNGWTVENSPGLSDGAWDRGVPAGGGERGDPPEDYDGSGQCYLTDNVYGNSDVDDGTTWLISPSFDLSSGIDYLVSYAVWYTNDFGGSPHSDEFKIYVSNNDGSSWELVETIGPVTSPGWNEYSFIVGDIVELTDQIKIRFEASDLGDGSVVEAGVDDFNIYSFQCAGVCGDLNNDETINIADITFLVSYLFGGGAAPEPLCIANVNGDTGVNIADLTYLVAYLFGGGPEPMDNCCENCLSLIHI